MQIYPIFTVPKTDMESGSGDPWTPTGWVHYLAQAGELIQWSADYVIGPHSIKINNLDGGQQTGFQTDTFVTEAGKIYRLKFWAKWTGEQAGPMKYLVKNGNGTTNMNGTLYNLATSGHTDWKMTTRDFLCTIAGSNGRVRFRGNSTPTTWLIDQVSLIELTGDSYYTPDPLEQLTVNSDFFMSSRGGDVWHHSIDLSSKDIAWDILNTNIQAIAWDILNHNSKNTSWDTLTVNSKDFAWDILNSYLQAIAWDVLNHNSKSTAWDILTSNAKTIAWDIVNTFSQPFSWSVFARVLYFIQQFFAKAICFDRNINKPIVFNRQLMEPVRFTLNTANVLVEDVHLAPQVDVARTFNLKNAIRYSYQIKEPINFDIYLSTVLTGEEDTINRG
jgi:hypothetical protein